MIDALVITAIVIAILVFILVLILQKRKIQEKPLPEKYKPILLQYVPFYNGLDEEKKKRFESRMAHFLSSVRITGVQVIVEDLDRVLVAASAIIPIFAFSNWEYSNLNEVLLYPENFSENFELEGDNRSVMGMVGWGAMQNTMVISQHELREGFLNNTGKQNTAIHEFVHLVDKTDGATDGIPENIMQRQYILPWLDLMQKNIKEIIKGRSDINPYGATNQAEFFAVVSEYFFERPDLFKTKHPELYGLLEEIFNQQPKTAIK